MEMHRELKKKYESNVEHIIHVTITIDISQIDKLQQQLIMQCEATR